MKLSRRSFLQIAAGLSTGLFGWLWHRLSVAQLEVDNQLEFKHNGDIPMGVSYFGKYYLYRTEKGVRAFSTTCTHAGCRIGKGTSKTLQCSCHGSQFNAETGIPLKGPAIRPLQEFECRFDPKTYQWMVELHTSSISSNTKLSERLDFFRKLI